MIRDKYIILINNENKTDEIETIDILENKAKVLYKSNPKVYTYGINKVRLIEKAKNIDTNMKNTLEYLKSLAKFIDSENNFLVNQLEKLTYISEECILSKYLRPSKTNLIKDESTVVFPFGFNLSQEKAITNALTNQVSIIEGPPGTGKTQTILNILANLIIRNKTVAVVSNNNAATKNVLEKLTKYDVGFISAFLGNKNNKEEFFDNQSLDYPTFICKQDNINIKELSKEIDEGTRYLKEQLGVQNKLALLKQEFEDFKIEKQHFQDLYQKKENNIKKYHSFKKHNSKIILSLWANFESLQMSKKDISIFFKLKLLIKYGIFSFSFYKNSLESIILLLQNLFYSYKEEELISLIKSYEKRLYKFDIENQMKLQSEKSMTLFKSFLSKKYKYAKNREQFSSEVLWKNFKSFIKEYPIVLSTTHSLRNSTGKNFLYDYLIIDESSQVDVVAGALALSCAKNLVVVGDLKQLPHVVTNEAKERVSDIFNKYKVNEAYHYKYNLLHSITQLFQDVPKVLLKEHYRCHPKIINFCNKKFYNNELIILTQPNDYKQTPLILYKTVEGNHARGTYNQRQIDVIENEIIPTLKEKDIGIVSPFRHQVNKINQTFKNNEDIKVDTVHKYQGREKKIIILSTVVDSENEFADDKNLLNVAISRAVDQLYVVVSDKEKNQNMKDLVNYIKYYNCDVKESKIYSIFDLLYKSYSPYLMPYLKKYKSVSQHKSENLMHIVINDVLKEEKYSHLDIALHIPLNNILRDYNLLTEEETIFAQNLNTHLDFIIFSKINKHIVLAIEVDGYKYHEDNPTQLKRDKLKDEILKKYNIPIIRFATNASQESRKLRECLANLV